jgi:four helix bundle protein
MPRRSLDHEKLQVYQRSLAFISWAEPLLDHLPKSLSVRDQLDRAGTSVPLNIAEGNGKFTSADRCRFFDNARGSVLECSACLDVLVAKGKAQATDVDQGKEMLVEITSMLFGLIRANSDERLFEEPGNSTGELFDAPATPVKYTAKRRTKRN